MTITVKSTSTFRTQKSSSCRLTHCTELYVRGRGAVAALQYRAGRGSRWYWIFMPSPHLLNLGKNRAQLRIAGDWNYHGCSRLTSVTHVVFQLYRALTCPPWDSCTMMWSLEISVVRWNSGSGCPHGSREMGRRTRDTRGNLSQIETRGDRSKK